MSQVNVNPDRTDRVYESDRDREGWSMGMVLGLVLGLVLLAALAWWAFASTAVPAGTDTNVSVTNNTPGGTSSGGTGNTGSTGSTGIGSSGSTGGTTGGMTGGTGSTTGGTGSTTGGTTGGTTGLGGR